MLRIGVAGVGTMGKIHLKAYLKHPGARVVALADMDESRRQGRLAPTQGNLELISSGAMDLSQLRSYADFRELCTADGIDVVSVCLPTDLHDEACILALDSGKHVFCEKPMALTPARARKMLQAARRNRRTLMIGHCLRFWNLYVKANEILAGGQYGRAVAASFVRSGGQVGGWFGQPLRSGGVPLDLHIHDADACVWYWGKPDRIDTGGAYVGESPNILHSRWRYKNGPAVTFECTWECAAGSPFYFSFKITLEKATLLFDSRNDKGLVLADEAGRQQLPTTGESAYVQEDNYFLDCVSAGRPVDRCPPRQSLLSLQCVTRSAAQLARACGRKPLFA